MKRQLENKPGIKPKRIIGLLKVKPMSVRQVTLALGLPVKKRLLVQSALTALKSDGAIIRMRGGLYGLPKMEKTTTGRLTQHQPGFAFLIPDNEEEEDLYLPASNLKDALPGDKVEVQVYKDDRFGGRMRAQVTNVIERCRKQLVGIFKKQRGYGLLKPDGLPFVRDFFIAKEDYKKAEDQDKVVAEVMQWPTQTEQGHAKIVEVLGKADDPGVDITSIIRRFGLIESFSLEAMKEAKKIAIEPADQGFGNRTDKRDLPIVTIDGADARDFDDAVYCRTNEDGTWHLEVHIADVAHYLEAGSKLDLEARQRGTSVYLPDRVLHMLPEELSCGVCSLVPNKERFALSAIMTIDQYGQTVNAEFERSVIKSAGRLTYEWVEEVISGRDGKNPAYAFKEMLMELKNVSAALRKNRDKRGNLDFDLPDAKVVLDEKGDVVTIEKRAQLRSHQLIEDCMIAANEAVATFLSKVDMPALYRVHEAPAGEKLEELQQFLLAYGYVFKPGKVKEASKTFQTLLLSWKGKPEEEVLNNALLRSMKLAVYQSKNTGHFGLGSPCYTHFTSPIRRYPDLVVHRALTEWIEKKSINGRRRSILQEKMVEWGNHLSQQERQAEKAERLAIKAKQVAFMKSKLGRTFEGTISSVKSFGFFVELDLHFVEGLVLMSDLTDDYYQYEKDQQYLYGVNSRQEFRTGMAVTIRVASVDEEEVRIFFHLVKAGNAVIQHGTKNPPKLVKARRRSKR